VSALLALVLLASAPLQPGTYRRAAPAADGVHVAIFLYLPERPRPGAPLVVLLPDLGTNHHVFDLDGQGLARALSARGLAVATLDWRGTGLSQVPARAPTLDDLLTLDLPAAANALGPARPLVLVGWGYSGALALTAAAEQLRARVRGVVSLNGVVRLDVPNLLVDRTLTTQGAPLDLARALSRPAPSRRGNLFDLLWVHPSPIAPSERADVLGQAMAPIAAPQVAQVQIWMRAGATTLGGRPYPALLADLRAPVLAIIGTRDNWTHPEFAAAIRGAVPAARLDFARLDTFEGAAHDVGHLGLVRGRQARDEVVPRIVRFVLAHAGDAP